MGLPRLGAVRGAPFEGRGVRVRIDGVVEFGGVSRASQDLVRTRTEFSEYPIPGTHVRQEGGVRAGDRLTRP